MTAVSFAQRLIDWQRQHGRHDLPWQNTRDPYRIWLSEIMLQQTQVVSVIPYYHRFLERWPTLRDLAAAPIDEVMALWSGLGYYARARNLHLCAQKLVDEHEYAGEFPHDPERLRQLPGIGRSTANAIAVFSFGICAPILDGNVKRVLSRVFAIENITGAAAEAELWQRANTLLPQRASDGGAYIQAQMDLGATICTRTRPDCAACPLAKQCIAHRDRRTHELPRPRSRSALRQRTVQLLLLREGERWLFERRPGVGIWGGLLSLPEANTQSEILQLGQAIGGVIGKLTALPCQNHTLTHLQLCLQPLSGMVRSRPQAQENSRYCWLTADEIDAAGLPAPIRLIVENARAQPR
jgi:A/G-specific adenine glycosylase